FTATPSIATAIPGKTQLALSAPHFLVKPVAGSQPYRVIVAGNQTLFFNDFASAQVGNVTLALANVKTYGGFYHPQTLALGADKRIWIADDDGHSYIEA